MMILTGEKGFTLVEVLVAVVIMGLAYVAILQSFSASARNIVKMEETRSSLLVNSILFDRELLSQEESEDRLIDSGEAMVEGSRYQLLLVSDENDNFMTLKLEKK